MTIRKKVGNDGDMVILYAQDPANPDQFVPVKATPNGDGTYSLDTQLKGSKAEEYESVTVDNTVGGVGLTALTYGTNTKAMITVEGATFRFRIDGGAPTSTVGHQAQVGDVIQLTSNEDIANFKAIRDTATDATIHVTYSS